MKYWLGRAPGAREGEHSRQVVRQGRRALPHLRLWAFAALVALAAPWQAAQAQVVCGETINNCSAKDVTVTSSAEPISCVIGTVTSVDVRYEVDTEATRYDLGAWFNAPVSPTASNC